MEYIRPDYYKKFVCVAGECEDSCCSGWQIAIDDESLEKYERYKEGGFANRLHNCINFEEQVFERDFESGRCAFLNEDNLCDIYAEISEDYLCRTCAEFPRHTEEYEDVREISLSLACPVAAELILSRTKSVSFEREETDEVDEDWDFDYLLFSKVADTRDLIVQILSDRSQTVEERMGKCLSLTAALQECLDDDDLFAMDNILENTDGQRDFDEDDMLSGKGAFQFLKELEPLKRQWSTDVEYALEEIENITEEERKEFRTLCYDCKTSYYKKVVDDGEVTNWSQMKEQLLVYFVFTHFGGSVYDLELHSKMRMAVWATNVIEDMCLLTWLKLGKEITFHEIAMIAKNFSREVEHSDINLDRVLEM